jgi:hypothetical protein
VSTRYAVGDQRSVPCGCLASSDNLVGPPLESIAGLVTDPVAGGTQTSGVTEACWQPCLVVGNDSDSQNELPRDHESQNDRGPVSLVFPAYDVLHPQPTKVICILDAATENVCVSRGSAWRVEKERIESLIEPVLPNYNERIVTFHRLASTRIAPLLASQFSKET